MKKKRLENYAIASHIGLGSTCTNTMLTEVIKCQICNKNNGKELHTCPYKEDVNDDYKSLCNCCSKCRHECCMHI